jgi:hypothetical protein
MIAIHWDSHINRLFDFLQVLEFLTIAKSDTLTASSSASCSAYSVNVGLGFNRNIKINDVTDVIDIDTASGNIGCD